MQFPDFLLIVPSSQSLSILVWLAIAVIILYMARKPAHKSILSATNIIFQALRFMSSSIFLAEKKLKERNKEVLLASGRVASEHMIEREFERIGSYVKKDLSHFPALHRDIHVNIDKLEHDYQKSIEVPPAPPEWAKAIESISNIPPSEDSMVSEILKSIKVAFIKGQQKALDAYRISSKQRHVYLKEMMPTLRSINKDLVVLDKNVQKIVDRSVTIDRHIDDYKEIVHKTDKAAQSLSSSSLTQFFIAGFVLAIAVGGAFINFNLIARPMQEMVGGSAYMMGFRVADIAALVIILVEISMGLFLMESMRITRLFPIIGALDDKLRVRMIIASFTFLFLLASVEAGLAYMRELLSIDDAALVAGLLSNGNIENMGVQDSGRWITTTAQMGMGFILPFALTFIAIPLESFIHSSRTVLGIMFLGLLRLLATSLRFIGNIVKYMGKSLVNIYDLFIFIPLWVEGVVVGVRREKAVQPKAEAATDEKKEKK